jgi:hypothetical protein
MFKKKKNPSQALYSSFGAVKLCFSMKFSLEPYICGYQGPTILLYSLLLPVSKFKLNERK